MSFQENPTDLNDVFHCFETRTNFEKNVTDQLLKREYRLDRMRALCKAWGNPQNKYDVIHIAGSKGKGSTAAYIAALLKESGSRVGVYTSPHLLDYRERFRVEGEDFPEKQAFKTAMNLIRRLPEVESQLVGEIRATTFELLTLFGFMLFRDLGCDTVVLECGLGGRLDATNVVERPLMVVLTPVEMEHIEILGPKLSDIAGEKAGIMKAGSVAWTSRQLPEVREVFRKKSLELQIPLHELDRYLMNIQEIPSRGFQWQLNWKDGLTEVIKLGMGTREQADNSALALAVVRFLRPRHDGNTPGTLQTVCLPGRFQILHRHPAVVLDGAHTPASISSVMRAFFSMPENDEESILLFGCARDKDHRAMAEILCSGSHPHFHRVIISTPGMYKPGDPVNTAKSFQQTRAHIELILNPLDAWIKAREYAGSSRGILVTGSFYLAGEIAAGIALFPIFPSRSIISP